MRRRDSPLFLARASGVGDDDAAAGALDDGSDGGGPGLAGAVGDPDQRAGQVLGEAVGGRPGEGGAPAAREAAGPPAGEGLGRPEVVWRGFSGRGWGRVGEIALEGVAESLAGPSGDVEVALRAERVQAAAELGADADLEGVAAHGVMTKYHKHYAA